MGKQTMFFIFIMSYGSLVTADNADQQQPEIEFLEYLAEMVSDRGEWLDPIQVNELAQNEHIEQNTDERKVEQAND